MRCPYCQKYISESWYKIRTMPENAYYFGVIVKILSDELGYTKEEIHEVLKAMFLTESKMIKTKDGVKEVVIPKSTKYITTIEAEEYYENIRRWASMELSIIIPTPNEGA